MWALVRNSLTLTLLSRSPLMDLMATSNNYFDRNTHCNEINHHIGLLSPNRSLTSMQGIDARIGTPKRTTVTHEILLNTPD